MKVVEAKEGMGQGSTWFDVSPSVQTPGTPGFKAPLLFFFPWGRIWGFSPPRVPFPFQRAISHLQSEGSNQGCLCRL